MDTPQGHAIALTYVENEAALRIGEIKFERPVRCADWLKVIFLLQIKDRNFAFMLNICRCRRKASLIELYVHDPEGRIICVFAQGCLTFSSSKKTLLTVDGLYVICIDH